MSTTADTINAQKDAARTTAHALKVVAKKEAELAEARAEARAAIDAERAALDGWNQGQN